MARNDPLPQESSTASVTAQPGGTPSTASATAIHTTTASTTATAPAPVTSTAPPSVASSTKATAPPSVKPSRTRAARPKTFTAGQIPASNPVRGGVVLDVARGSGSITYTDLGVETGEYRVP
ncbi:hypothetical protein [Neomicrococcus lactis]|uniref:hypothetical protein n=1 Tax=Neomicrococcus lactis TaxID=732241 RepID=UPI0023007434|nr:hypothetical protein [Neomicrococcus lactis]